VNQYEWIWEGQTQLGRCPWGTEGGELKYGTEWSGALENEIIEKTKATYYSTIVAEFVRICKEQGITVNLVSVDVQCEIVKGQLEGGCQSYYNPNTDNFTEKCNWVQNFYVKVKGTVVFESEVELAGSPIAPALLIALAKAIAIVIVAIGVAWGVYEFLKNLTLNETSSVIHTIKYDAQGNKIEETWETKKTQEPSWTSWIGIIAVVIVAFMFLLVVPLYLPKGSGKSA